MLFRSAHVLLLATLSCALMAACISTERDETGPPTWKPGYTWSYGDMPFGSSNAIMRVLNRSEVRGTSAFIVESGQLMYSPFHRQATWAALDPRTLREVGEILDTSGCDNVLVPARGGEMGPLFDFPLKLGKSWTGVQTKNYWLSQSRHDLAFPFVATVVGKDVVALEAGNFTAWHVQYAYGDSSWFFTPGSRTREAPAPKASEWHVSMDLWYSEEVQNVVKHVSSETSGNWPSEIRPAQNHTYILQRFELNETSPEDVPTYRAAEAGPHTGPIRFVANASFPLDISKGARAVRIGMRPYPADAPPFEDSNTTFQANVSSTPLFDPNVFQTFWSLDYKESEDPNQEGDYVPSTYGSSSTLDVTFDKPGEYFLHVSVFTRSCDVWAEGTTWSDRLYVFAE